MRERGGEILMHGSFDPRIFSTVYPILKAAVEESPANGTFDVDGLKARIIAAEHELKRKK